MKTKIRAIFSLFMPPCRIKNFILSLLGWQIDKSSYVGFSYISAKNIKLKQFSHIGHLNFITAKFVQLDEKAYIRHLNRITGPLCLVMKERSAIGNLNTIKRDAHPISWGKSILKLGVNSKITSKHLIDCTRPVKIGSHSILAGMGSQVWTHGYLHAPKGSDRFRIDGSVSIGDNVYIGSASIINPGVCIHDAITIGSGTTIAKTLEKPGLYVNGSPRFIPLDYHQAASKYPLIKASNQIEKVVHKKCQKPHAI